MHTFTPKKSFTTADCLLPFYPPGAAPPPPPIIKFAKISPTVTAIKIIIGVRAKFWLKSIGKSLSLPLLQNWT